jgi:hypothetical protein
VLAAAVRRRRPDRPPAGSGLVHVWSTRHRNRAVHNGLHA